MSTENVSANISGNTDWTYYFKELTIPANAYYYDIRLSLTGPVGTASALFDNIGLIEWTAWTPADSLAEIAWPNNFYWMQAKTTEGAKSLNISLNEKEFYASVGRDSNPGRLSPPQVKLYPNPFNPVLNISLDLPRKAPTTVQIYNIRGQLVKTLLHGISEPGKQQLSWDGKDSQGSQTASGVYFIRVDNGGMVSLRKAILMK